MKQKTAYAVFTQTDTGKDYMVKGNFGDNKKDAETWAENHANDANVENEKYDASENARYPNGLFVKEVNY